MAEADPDGAPRVTKDRVRPRDAATLILVRRDGPEPRLLMGQRHGAHVFMPHKWVFPGGRIHPSDFRVPVARELPDAVAHDLKRTAPSARARALALAAIRETWEEVGLLLARAAPPTRSRGEWQSFLAAGALPDLGGLSFVARAITPPGRVRRFDARFFMADAAGLISLDPARVSGELEGIAWKTLPEVRALDLPTVTRWVIDEIEERLGGYDGPARFANEVWGRGI